MRKDIALWFTVNSNFLGCRFEGLFVDIQTANPVALQLIGVPVILEPIACGAIEFPARACAMIDGDSPVAVGTHDELLFGMVIGNDVSPR